VEDGVTIRIPQHQASTIPTEAIDWLVPGLYEDKIRSLLKGLPKYYRKQLVPLTDTVETIVREMPKGQTALSSALSRFIHQRYGLDIPADAWPIDQLPDHLNARIAITGPEGEELRSSRDKGILYQKTSVSVHRSEFEKEKKRWEKFGLTEWTFGDLPEKIEIPIKGGRRITVFPALETSGKAPAAVNLRLYEDRDRAGDTHQRGVAELYAIRFAKDLKFLKKSLAFPAGQHKAPSDFGGARGFQNRLYEKVLYDLFHRNIRSKQAFEAHAATVGPAIMSLGRNLLDQCIPVLNAYHQADRVLYQLGVRYRKDQITGRFLSGLKTQLSRLVPENFLDLYDANRIEQLPRFIRAIEIRAQRAVVNMDKDQAKSAALQPVVASLKELLDGLSSAVSVEKHEAVEEYFWMIEEYKVSLFAQELKTAISVSGKRLEKKLSEIRRMA
jgi:ATP-dependent helicase HrpA